MNVFGFIGVASLALGFLNVLVSRSSVSSFLPVGEVRVLRVLLDQAGERFG